MFKGSSDRQLLAVGLLEHSSGLGDYCVKNDSIYDWLGDPVTEQQILNEIIRQGSLFSMSLNAQLRAGVKSVCINKSETARIFWKLEMKNRSSCRRRISC